MLGCLTTFGPAIVRTYKNSQPGYRLQRYSTRHSSRMFQDRKKVLQWIDQDVFFISATQKLELNFQQVYYKNQVLNKRI